MDVEHASQQRMAFGARDNERMHLLNNLSLLGRSAQSGRVRSLVELVARIAGDSELRWTMDSLCTRLNLPERTMRRTIELAETSGVLHVARLRRADRSYDRLALTVHWARLASRQLAPLADGAASPGPVRPTWPDGPANLAAPDRPTWPDGPANLAGQYKQEQAIPPPPPTPTATATAADPRGDTGPQDVSQPIETSWAAAAECLRRTGFASWRRLIVDSQQRQITPDELIKACETYQANKPRFAGPGAIAAWVRNGDWPVNGIKPPEEARVRLATRETERSHRDLEAWAYRVIADGQRQGRSRSEIAAALRQRGYVWS